MSDNDNKVIASEAKEAFNNSDRGSLPSRENGYIGGHIGGNMVKRMIEAQEREMSEQ